MTAIIGTSGQSCWLAQACTIFFLLLHAHMFPSAGDGECFYRAMLVGLVESLSAAAPKKTQTFIRRLTTLHGSLPNWTRTLKVDYGFHLLAVTSIHMTVAALMRPHVCTHQPTSTPTNPHLYPPFKSSAESRVT